MAVIHVKARQMIEALAAEAIAQAQLNGKQCQMLGLPVDSGTNLNNEALLIANNALFDNDWLLRELQSAINRQTNGS